jgi:hypothetical protein
VDRIALLSGVRNAGGRLVMAADTQTPAGWQHLGDNVYIAPPARGVRSILPQLPGVPPQLLVIAGPLVGALMMAAATVYAAYVGLSKTLPPADCASALSHFDEARKRRDPIDRKVLLIQHMTLFPTCKFIGLIPTMLAEIEHSQQLGSAAASDRVAPVSQAIPVQFEEGERYRLSRGDVYRVQAVGAERTRIMIEEGFVTLSTDKVRQFQCQRAEIWMNHDRGAEHQLTVCSDWVVIRVLGVD